MGVATAPMPRGEVFKVLDADKPAWRNVTVTLMHALPTGWSAYGCNPINKEFTRLDFPVSLKVEKG